jgi:phenylacetate-CoA ligase
VYAKKNVPFYQDVFKNIDPRSFRTLADLSQVPTLSKTTLKQRAGELVNPSYDGLVLRKTTGGSTGAPVTIFHSSESLAAIDAAYWRGYGWAGISMCDKQARFWGVPHGWKARLVSSMKDLALNRLRCSAFSINDEDLSGYYRKLDRFSPRFLYGYVSMLEVFARFLLRERLTFTFPLTAVIATSEVLTASHRKLFAEVFKCRVFNEYGCGEVGTIAHECEEGALHISAENMIIEIVKDGKQVGPGEKGDIVVTELNNIAMPLIRYNLEDIGWLEKNTCSCGRNLPVLGDVVGRSYDTIYNKEGKSFHGEFFMYMFEELQDQGVGVSSFQVIQENFEKFTIKMVMASEAKHVVESYIEKRVKESYGDYAKLEVHLVDSIPREKSGKIRLIKTLLT